MRPKRIPGTLRSNIDQFYPGVIWCESHTTCRQGLSKDKHHRGFVDNFGRVHYSRGHLLVRSDGLHRALRLVALAVNRPMRSEVWYLREYHAIQWATREMKRNWHRSSKAAWSWTLRQRIRKVKHLRSIDFECYIWSRYGATPKK